MKRRNKKIIEKWDGIIIPGLIEKVPGIYKEIIANTIETEKINAETAKITNDTSVTILETTLRLINNDRLPEVKMMRKIITQIPHAKYN